MIFEQLNIEKKYPRRMNTHQYYLNKIKNHVKISMIRILSISISSPNVKFYYIYKIFTDGVYIYFVIFCRNIF